MAAQFPPIRKPFTLGECCRVRGGAIVAIHGPHCASRAGGECGCDPRYALKRVRTSGRTR
jgi:hypothetical protein